MFETVSGPYQVVIPMAGLGSRFSEAGYSVPKPMLSVHGVEMFRVVLSNVISEQASLVVVVAQRIWNMKAEIESISRRVGIPIKLVEIDQVTDGPAETIELAKPFLNLNLPVVTANSDQYVDADLKPFFDSLYAHGVSGAILTMNDTDPKWSYVKVNERDEVIDVQEKQVISNIATVGIYGFSSALTMYTAFEQMRVAGATVNGEYYVAPAYKQLIDRGCKVVTWNLGDVAEVMFGMGIPEDYENFLVTEVSFRAAERARKLGLQS